MKRNFLKYNLPSILWAAFILVASLLPTKRLPEVHVSDKLIHTSFYSLLFILTYFGWKKQHQFLLLKQKTVLILLTVIPLFGFVIEVLQGTCTADRQFDLWDALANTVGAMIGWWLVLFFTSTYSCKKMNFK